MWRRRSQGTEAGSLNASGPLYEREAQEETALHGAVRRRESVREENLRQFAAERNINDMPPLYLAIFLGYRDIAEELIKTFGDSLSYDGPDGQNALHVAALRSKDLTQIVIDERPDLRNAPDDSGSIPLHFAASAGVEGVTRLLLLLGEGSTGINMADDNGMRPIHVAASVGAMDAVRALLDGDNHPTPRDNRGRTVTFAAAFTMPGSYKIGGDPMAGTPELGRHYGFKVFLVADILAFYCSVVATFSLAEYGDRDDVDPLVRHIYARRGVWLFHIALRSVIVAFALGVSVVMWDISIITTVIVGIAALGLVVYGNEALAHDLRFMWVMYCRFGFSPAWYLYPSTSSHLEWTTRRLKSFSWTLVSDMFKLFWTYGLIFVVAYIATLKVKDGH